MSDEFCDGDAPPPILTGDGAQRSAEIVILRTRLFALECDDPADLRRAEHLLGLLRDRVRARRNLRD